jgi:hypothetical protein
LIHIKVGAAPCVMLSLTVSKSGRKVMSSAEFGYLCLVIGAGLVFAAVLAWTAARSP